VSASRAAPQLIFDKLQIPQFLDQIFLLEDPFVAINLLALRIQKPWAGTMATFRS
jgi:hypothetical protein